MSKGKIITIVVLVAAIAVLGGMIVFAPGAPESVQTDASGGLAFSSLPLERQEQLKTTQAPSRAASPEPDPSPANNAVLDASSSITPEMAPSQTPEQEKAPEPAPSATPEPTPAPTPSPTPEALKTEEPQKETSGAKPLKGLIIGVDPGHQIKANREQEPVSPGSSDTKNKVSSGTQGVYTKIAEHEVNLNVGLKLQKLLADAGATVIMTRTSTDVNISNVERAQLFNKKKVDLGVRIHCNGSTDQSVTGAFMLVPKDKNYPYYSENVKAAKCILEAYGKATGIGTKKGITYRADQTGFNWCERPIVNIEMGHMTNKEEDLKLTNKDFQSKMAKGIYNGIVDYFTS
ncbi:N-acetylmuramoyl-L-alanine amidase [Christensenellaceae bacterium OttesenSCG-928-M15]|nr:N-acetylmuramoyl-L-alanine amidase [Christensenellaceae bacterium OttesenSCG-928-M15]